VPGVRVKGLDRLKPGSVGLYLAAKADCGASVATLEQALAAIGQAYQSVGLESPRRDPVVREVWSGIKREKLVAQQQAAPLTPAQLRAISKTLTDDLVRIRDRALLLIGFAAALRRSELVGLNASDVQDTENGLVLSIRRSKGDQEGRGRQVGVPYGSFPATCPVRALRAWLKASGIVDGPLFRAMRHKRLSDQRLSGKDVARIVKRSAKQIGLDTSHLSGHSLRAGLATAAAKAGKPAHAIAIQTGHKTTSMVQRYIREAELLGDGNAAMGIGL
jgi:integrase